MEHCQSIRESILQNGFPNFYGTQRFGKNNQTIEQGLELLQYPDSEKSRKLKRNRSLLRLSLSALQSALFNNALIERISENLIHQVLDGDVMKVTLTGGVFIVENLETEQERFNQHEIVTTGPIYGPKMKQPGDQVREREAAILESAGLKEDIFKAYRKLTAGTRRPFLIWPEEIEINPEKDGICFEFELPSGVYATSLMREFMKTDENQA